VSIFDKLFGRGAPKRQWNPALSKDVQDELNSTLPKLRRVVLRLGEIKSPDEGRKVLREAGDLLGSIGPFAEGAEILKKSASSLSDNEVVTFCHTYSRDLSGHIIMIEEGLK